jgi:hypothetical protein
MTYELGLIPCSGVVSSCCCAVSATAFQAVGFATAAALLSFESTIL